MNEKRKTPSECISLEVRGAEAKGLLEKALPMHGPRDQAVLVEAGQRGWEGKEEFGDNAKV